MFDTFEVFFLRFWTIIFRRFWTICLNMIFNSFCRPLLCGPSLSEPALPRHIQQNSLPYLFLHRRIDFGHANFLYKDRDFGHAIFPYTKTRGFRPCNLYVFFGVFRWSQLRCFWTPPLIPYKNMGISLLGAGVAGRLAGEPVVVRFAAAGAAGAGFCAALELVRRLSLSFFVPAL
jgi:hypothetical protein